MIFMEEEKSGCFSVSSSVYNQWTKEGDCDLCVPFFRSRVLRYCFPSWWGVWVFYDEYVTGSRNHDLKLLPCLWLCTVLKNQRYCNRYIYSSLWVPVLEAISFTRGRLKSIMQNEEWDTLFVLQKNQKKKKKQPSAIIITSVKLFPGNICIAQGCLSGLSEDSEFAWSEDKFTFCISPGIILCSQLFTYLTKCYFYSLKLIISYFVNLHLSSRAS